MQHQRKGRTFGRKSDQRRAMMKSLASSFFLTGHITTTEAKAKELRPFVEKAITRAKKPTPSNRRLLARAFSASVVRRIIDEASRLENRNGGYARIIKLGARKTDAARMAVIELLK